MADQNLKDFTISWVLFGLLFTCLITFATLFMFSNNPDGLGSDAQNVFNSTQQNLQNDLYDVTNNTNELSNITSKTNPETSFLGSRDSVATSYGLKSTGRNFWSNARIMISWIFTGDIGKMVISVFGGLIGILSIYFITKWIRTGT